MDALVGGLAIVAAATGLSVVSQRAIAARRVAGQSTTPGRVARWAIVLLVGVAPAGGLTIHATGHSRLPDSYAHGATHDGPVAGGVHRSVTELTGPANVRADRVTTLTARVATLALDDGSTVEGWTFDGVAPGPLLRVTVGELLLPAGGRYDITFTMPDRAVNVRALLDARERKLADRGVADPVLTLANDTSTWRPARLMTLPSVRTTPASG